MLKIHKIEPCIISYSILIDGYNRLKLNEKSMEIFEQLNEKNVKFDKVLYTNLVDGIGYRRDK